jgi:hypothetical protein
MLGEPAREGCSAVSASSLVRGVAPSGSLPARHGACDARWDGGRRRAALHASRICWFGARAPVIKLRACAFHELRAPAFAAMQLRGRALPAKPESLGRPPCGARQHIDGRGAREPHNKALQRTSARGHAYPRARR